MTRGDRLGDRLLYGACWEDLDVARAALRVPRDGMVVAIAAAGDNAIGLLLDEPRRVLAIDLNPAQVALAELKLAALRAASPRLAAFLGGVPAAREPDPGRLAAYDLLRPALSPAAARYWDAHAADIAGGAIRSGRFERYLSWFRRGILPVAPGRGTVRAMLAAPDVAEQARLYRERWDSRRWRFLVRAFFGRRLLAAAGRHPAFFDQAGPIDAGAHYLERAAAGLTDTPIGANPYLTFMLTGAYRIPAAAPAYLQPRHAAVLRARSDRLALERCSLLDALRGLPDRSVDAFYLSDIFELADPAEYAAALEEIARTGKAGARLCYWNNLVRRTRPETLADRIAPDDGLAAAHHRSDRAFLYTRLVVEEVRSPVALRHVRGERGLVEVSHAAR